MRAYVRTCARVCVINQETGRTCLARYVVGNDIEKTAGQSCITLSMKNSLVAH